MPALTKEQLAERKKGIGGSDAGDLISAPPYGCIRRLGAEKAGLEPDRPEEEKKVYERGHALEDPFADKYAKNNPTHKVQIIKDQVALGNARGKALRKDRPYFKLNIDRRVLIPERGPKLMEIKSCGEKAYEKYQAEGPPLYMLAQVQWGLGYTGWDDSVLWIGEANGWNFWGLPIERDEESIQFLLAKADWLWPIVENVKAYIDAGGDRIKAWDYLPEQLHEGSVQCDGCEFMWGCRGADYQRALKAKADKIVVNMIDDPEFMEAAEDWLAAKPLLDQADEDVKTAKDIMQERMKKRGAISVVSPGFAGTRNPGERQYFDQKAHAAGCPDCHAEYTRTAKTRTFRPRRIKAKQQGK